MSIDLQPGRSAAELDDIEYPDSDGLPMSDNTKQFRWIVTVQGNLDGMYASDPNVFVAGDLLWYPVKGRPDIRGAPDTLVVFGRPKGDRGSYKQWLEVGIAPQVVWEILSPGNRALQMVVKKDFYERYGVEEYYVYDPDTGEAEGWIRRGKTLQKIANLDGWVSPRLGIRFQMENGELVLYKPNGERFLTFLELQQQREEADRQAKQAKKQAKQAKKQAEQAKQKEEQAKQKEEQARKRAEKDAQRAAAAEAEAARLRALVEELKKQLGQS